MHSALSSFNSGVEALSGDFFISDDHLESAIAPLDGSREKNCKGAGRVIFSFLATLVRETHLYFSSLSYCNKI